MGVSDHLYLKIPCYAILRIKSSGNLDDLTCDYKLRGETKKEYLSISCLLQAADGQRIGSFLAFMNLSCMLNTFVFFKICPSYGIFF
ncbi:hypothetical protein T4D_5544 [Trichinella pseudospiralis]|uniref:Uncharacterized protein n=1 Tax=Trichinella pseudospiralis TaxID=6337 RepID=A0A0V1FCT0_TRIPS|nr:hypothetical protein T4D_5544 [Trichinella pseudospiralis]